MGELKTEVTLVANSLVDGVKRKAGDKVLVPVSLADAFGKGRALTPEQRAEIIEKQQAAAQKADQEEQAKAKAALKEVRETAKAEKAEAPDEKPAK